MEMLHLTHLWMAHLRKEMITTFLNAFWASGWRGDLNKMLYLLFFLNFP